MRNIITQLWTTMRGASKAEREQKTGLFRSWVVLNKNLRCRFSEIKNQEKNACWMKKYLSDLVMISKIHVKYYLCEKQCYFPWDAITVPLRKTACQIHKYAQRVKIIYPRKFGRRQSPGNFHPHPENVGKTKKTEQILEVAISFEKAPLKTDDVPHFLGGR